MIYRQEIHVTSVAVVPAREIFSVEKSRTSDPGVYDLWYSPGEYVYYIHTYGTGHQTPWDELPAARDDYDFLGTVVTDSGLVWHSFATRIA